MYKQKILGKHFYPLVVNKFYFALKQNQKYTYNLLQSSCRRTEVTKKCTKLAVCRPPSDEKKKKEKKLAI